MIQDSSTICRGSLSRFSLSFAQILFGLGCLGAVIAGIVLIGVGIHRGDIVYTVLSLVGSAGEFILSFAFLVVFTTVKENLFSQEPPEEPTVVVPCENGHKVTVTKAQAGSTVECPTCGCRTTVPAFSESQWHS